ncbi:MAG: hypothetical protein NPINA01_09620 [Nitrospinaceae bacterium]|nr:MAG: hypothetical protein NPINA01_09620 [Nitrospinaceae bacterium]
MKQIFCPHKCFKTLIFLIIALFLGCIDSRESISDEPVYTIIGQEIKGVGAESFEWSRDLFETLGTEEISSAYFDKALGYEGSKFRVINFAKLVKRFDPDGLSDAVLLNCFDDYQGILSITDIKRYHIRLATRIEIRPEFQKPDWLNPLLLIIPDNRDVPFQERYLTANIRELRFTKLQEYYAPLAKARGPEPQSGFSSFKNNCLFCHSLMGIGGNKGVRLLEVYDFSKDGDTKRFLQDFLGFHHSNNPDKQDIGQFVSDNQLKAIAEFLHRVKGLQSDASPQ